MSTFTTGWARHLVKKISLLIESFVAFARALTFGNPISSRLFTGSHPRGSLRCASGRNTAGARPMARPKL
jgi:hypothetical protein